MDSTFSMYVLSNGSLDSYPDNTLSKFSTKLPFSLDLPIHFNERWGIAIQGIGLSSKFISEYATNSQMPLMIELLGFKDHYKCEGYTIDEECRANISQFNQLLEQITNKNYYDSDSTRTYSNGDLIQQLDNWSKRNLQYMKKIKLDKNGYGNIEKAVGYNFYYNTLKDIASLDSLIEYLKSSSLKVDKKCDTNIVISNGDFDIERVFFIRKDLYDKSNITQTIKYQTDNNQIDISEDNYLFDNDTNARLINKSSIIMNNTTYVVFVMNREFLTINLDFQRFSENYLSTPNLIKIKCDNIRTQVFNNTHSKDIEIIKPKFAYDMGHYFHEFENPIYVPLLNTTLRELSFELTDEHNDRLKLAEGIATLLQINFKRMSTLTKSFSVRLSPVIKNNEDLITSFETILPANLSFNENWRVGLKEITFPSSIKSLPNDNNEITINILDDNMNIVPLTEVKSIILNDVFDSNSLPKYLNEQTSMYDLLNFSMNDDNLFVSVKNNCEIGVTYNLAKFLGMNMSGDSTIAKLKINKNIPVKIGKVNWNIFRPAYLMIYTDLVKPTLISSNYANILKVVPVKSKEKDMEYQSSEFKTVEFREIASNAVNVIKIDVRSHSGELVQFNSNFLSLHLYFTNSPYQ